MCQKVIHILDMMGISEDFFFCAPRVGKKFDKCCGTTSVRKLYITGRKGDIICIWLCYCAQCSMSLLKCAEVSVVNSCVSRQD